ncbi:MAG: ATP-binding protein [Candidatus Margulisiibacteriota bacterium]|nr:MAG: ATP-binding protein [Candidatus Margulisbacteria bacterium GWE2_39_32]PZM83821.1 MAG: ATP-binding protein [Candidatus Margulisiibacteriota bacterium]
MGIVAHNVGKTVGDTATRILSRIDLSIDDGDFIALTGRSGSGKSTLIYILSTLDNPTEGILEIDRINITAMAERDLERFRNEKVGVVFQFHYLLSELTAIENVLMPARKAGRDKQLREKAESLLFQFDLGDKTNRLPRQLSGGEQQRVAIARALILDPSYIFADEPTGNLDSKNAEIVMDIFCETNKSRHTTIVMVTHDPAVAGKASRQVRMLDGRIV